MCMWACVFFKSGTKGSRWIGKHSLSSTLVNQAKGHTSSNVYWVLEQARALSFLKFHGQGRCSVPWSDFSGAPTESSPRSWEGVFHFWVLCFLEWHSLATLCSVSTGAAISKEQTETQLWTWLPMLNYMLLWTRMSLQGRCKGLSLELSIQLAHSNCWDWYLAWSHFMDEQWPIRHDTALLPRLLRHHLLLGQMWPDAGCLGL